ncbi:MAG: hypothetical protein IPI58_01710 [Alphaproteobacteria bacterium]|nr:MAG: hypothetical protein IPI58_01710 [Alphaproteobacteria bacterium]
MNVEHLYAQFLTLDAEHRDMFQDGRIVRVGPSSVVIIPEAQPEHIIKIIKPGHTPHGLSVAEEFKTLQRLQSLDGEYFVTPIPISWGASPDYIEMQRLGKGHGWDVTDPREIERIGRALGEFSALLFEIHGSIHTDICNGNYTDAPNGKIGIIDIASVKETDIPENLFFTPLLSKPNISPHIAAEFQKRIGRPIDFELVQGIVMERLPKLLLSKEQESATNIKRRVDSNLQEWRDMRSDIRTCHRPAKRLGPTSHQEGPVC